MNFLRSQPALAGALASLLGAVAGLFIDNPELVAALVGVAAVFLGVRQVVTPVTKAVEVATEAATTAATEVAKNLGDDVVGVVGEITGPAQAIVNETVATVVGGVLDKARLK
jgi:hypothetical protein